jgi:hypothetical protein
MLTQLVVENFKALKGRHVIPLAPITLVYGPNSAGKSSVMQALLLLKQSLDAGRFTPRGRLVDLGSFESAVWGHDLTRPIRLGVTFRNTVCFPDVEVRSLANWVPSQHYGAVLTFLAQRTGRGDTARVRLDACRFHADGRDPFGERAPIDVRLRYDARVNSQARFDWQYRFHGKGSGAWVRRLLEHSGLPHGPAFVADMAAYTRTALLPHEIARKSAMERGPVPLEPGQSLSDVTPLAWTGAQGLTDLRENIESTMSTLRYIGPLRIRPGRTHSPLDEGAEYVGSSGEHTLQQLWRARRREGKLAAFDRWLSALDIPYRVEVEPAGDEVLGDGIKTRLVDLRTKVRVGLPDVGSGVGQVLPLLVQAASEYAQILCVEQPELHLHPRAQSALGDVFLESTESREDGDPYAVQWLVETHSETLLLRLKRRIREGKLWASNVSVLYVEPGRGGSVVKRLRLDERGDFIDDWPHGFFEESFNELFT